ncbi:hypothetical protein [Kribbella sp. VKM Ac-2566]|uniref:hypothetical protein n=1 Tax=Kribbella sp. VKM Ac-2566 TaxID=2512218 RepID=UPI0010630DE9|nr:hypothetical protein [Kribbella sp. VKM Ac-2566]TDX08304.1 hypothetical protein EV647_0580 [Kribbella sp. VKM Ac-2566]
MSEPSAESTSRGAASRSEGVMRRQTRRAVGDSQKQRKGAYAQLARDMRRTDPAVREWIGRADLTQPAGGDGD